MTFADPAFLVLLAVLPLLLFLRRRLPPESPPGVIPSLALLAAYRPTWRVRLAWAPTAVRAAALVLLVVALARPQSGQAENELPGQGIDIALVLDTSGSMSASLLGTDTRLVVAKRVLGNFVVGRKDDRLALVIFRDQSLVLSPPTLDYDALLGLISQVERVNLADGTAIGLGLADGLDLLRDSRARSRVVGLPTDGENNNRTIEPLAAARIAQTLGIRVYTIGVIDPTTRGASVANVDERALQEMANLTGGKYFPAESEEALGAIYDSIDSLEKSHVGRTQFAAYNELSIYFLAAALALLTAEALLRTTVWRRAA